MCLTAEDARFSATSTPSTPIIDVKSLHLHDTRRDMPNQMMERDQGVMQGVLSRALFRRPSLSGQKSFTILSLHISNICAKKKGIAEKLTSTIRAIMKTPGLRPTDQNCHHKTWLHLEFVDWRSTQLHHEEHDRRMLLKERPTACPCGQQRRRITMECMS